MELVYDEKNGVDYKGIIAETAGDELRDIDYTEFIYDNAIEKSDKYYQDQIDATKNWEKTQTKNQNDQTAFTIDQINQQKDQAKNDYIKEQSGAYVDWQKQSNEYGANAEKRASAGLDNTGYSESSQVSMYNTYQNRVTTARESYMRAVLNYDNAIKEARLQNNSILAEIAYNALKQQLELSLAGFQYKNTLVLQKAADIRDIKTRYSSIYMEILSRIQQEEALEEKKRQFDAQMAFENSKFEWQKDQATKEFEWKQAQAAKEEEEKKNDNNKNTGYILAEPGSAGVATKGITPSIENHAKQFKNNEDLAAWLDRMTAEGYLTEEEADTLYSKYFRLMTPEEILNYSLQGKSLQEMAELEINAKTWGN